MANRNPILKIELSKGRYGGRIYENDIFEQVKNNVDIDTLYLMKYSLKLLNIPRLLLLFIKFRYFYKGRLLLNDHTSWLAGRKSTGNILLIHHIDNSHSPFVSKIFQALNHYALEINKSLFNKTIVVSTYWQTKLRSMGFSNVSVVYNSFDLSLFTVTDEEKQKFRDKYFSNQKPVVYLGNSLVKKGVIQAYEELKNLDVNFVTSGKTQTQLPCLNLNLSYKEYLTLLSVSDLVLTMSLFQEGWNRTAHEATLLGTTVIGSGKGGMKELLEKSNQIICEDFGGLKEAVVNELFTTRTPTLDKKFVLGLHQVNFRKAWLKILLDDKR